MAAERQLFGKAVKGLQSRDLTPGVQGLNIGCRSPDAFLDAWLTL